MKFLASLCLPACATGYPDTASTDAALVVQAQSRWCWAAAAKSVGDAITHRDVPQCELVSSTRERDCCTEPELCNAPGGTGETPLLRVYGLPSALWGVSPQKFLVSELAEGRPVILVYKYPARGRAGGVRSCWVRAV